MPVGRRLAPLATLAAIAALVGVVACSSDSSVAPGNSVADAEIDQTVASDVGESFAGKVGEFRENESFHRMERHAHGLRESSLDAHGLVRVDREAGEGVLDQ